MGYTMMPFILPAGGSKWGYNFVFSCDQNNTDLSGVYVTWIYFRLSVESRMVCDN